MKFKLTNIAIALDALIGIGVIKVGNTIGCYYGTLYISIPCSIMNLGIAILITALIFDFFTSVILPKIRFARIIKIAVKPYIYPRRNKVGITIYNKENQDIDIYINLATEILQSYRNPNIFGWTTQGLAKITYGKEKTSFDLGQKSIIKADFEETFILAETQNNVVAFLLKDKPILANLLPIPNIVQPTYHSFETKWGFEFEIRGTINGDLFKKQRYRTEITSTRTVPVPTPDGRTDSKYDTVTIEIGDVTRVS